MDYICVPHRQVAGLPDGICVCCSPQWEKIGVAGERYCKVWTEVVAAVAASDFKRAAVIRESLKPIASELDQLLESL
jgi:hypothetical protein